MMAAKNPVYVMLDNPTYLKKSIIESAIDSVILLREYEKLKLTEKQIETLSARFITLIRGIERQIDSLHSLMPHVTLPEFQGKMLSPTVFDESKLENMEDHELAIQSKEELSLEEELSNIEEQLKNIAI